MGMQNKGARNLDNDNQLHPTLVTVSIELHKPEAESEVESNQTEGFSAHQSSPRI
jgi:hypothetical protein